MRGGVVALEPHGGGRTTRASAAWDASRLDTAAVVDLAGLAVER